MYVVLGMVKRNRKMPETWGSVKLVGEGKRWWYFWFGKWELPAMPKDRRHNNTVAKNR